MKPPTSQGSSGTVTPRNQKREKIVEKMTDLNAFIRLNEVKRDLRTIEEIQKDMKTQVPSRVRNPESGDVSEEEVLDEGRL